MNTVVRVRFALILIKGGSIIGVRDEQIWI